MMFPVFRLFAVTTPTVATKNVMPVFAIPTMMMFPVFRLFAVTTPTVGIMVATVSIVISIAMPAATAMKSTVSFITTIFQMSLMPATASSVPVTRVTVLGPIVSVAS